MLSAFMLYNILAFLLDHCNRSNFIAVYLDNEKNVIVLTEKLLQLRNCQECFIVLEMHKECLRKMNEMSSHRWELCKKDLLC